MMYKEKSGAGRKVKALALVPMSALALCVAGMPAVRAAVSTINASDISIGKVSESPATANNKVHVFKVKGLNNNGNCTTVTITGEGFGDNINVSGGTFKTNGKTYQAKSMQCNLTDGVATIEVVFPFMDEWDKSSMTLTINGEETVLDIEELFNNSQIKIVQTDAVIEYTDSQKIVGSIVYSDDATANSTPVSVSYALPISSQETGTDPAIVRIRGKKSTDAGQLPLLIIDGVEGDIKNIDFSQVESISVLKDDVAVSKYGSRASNGVIQVTTKREVEDKADDSK